MSIFAHPTELAEALAQSLLELLLKHPPDRPFFVALSGGSTPRLLYETLAKPPYKESIPWEKLHLFFGDERAVPPGSPESNFQMVSSALLSHVPVLCERMCAEDNRSLEYEALLRRHLPPNDEGWPVFDLILLGMGNDGHTASLFPHTPALSERQRCVVMNPAPQPPSPRMTLTYPVLHAARRLWLIVTGESKRAILHQIHKSPATPETIQRWPILGLQAAQGELLWWLDQAAVSPEGAEREGSSFTF